MDGALELTCMKVIRDVRKHRPLLNTAIKKYGHSVEHNLHHYLATEAPGSALVAFSFPGGMYALGNLKNDVLGLFPDGILAPPERRFRILQDILSYALVRNKMKKVTLEVSEPFRREIVSGLAASRRFRACRANGILYWPVFRMELFDSRLKGRRWKKMRNIRNRFAKHHRIRTVDSKKVPKGKLLAVLRQWERKRRHSDTVTREYYQNVIGSGFRGFRTAKTIYVDGEPCTITAGWNVQNGEKHYYSAIGILNYRHKGLGEFANLMDLILLKKKGYKLVDFGGSGYSLLNFKNKFRPQHMYKTYLFSIVRRK